MHQQVPHQTSNRSRVARGAIRPWIRGALVAGGLLLSLAFAAPAGGAFQCTNDMQGANDEPGQKDLTQFCRDDAAGPPTYDFLVTWNWDDTAWSGSNTGDACALFDTDGDVFANFALCVTVTGKPAHEMSVREYSCGDDRRDRCTNSVEIATFASMCDASVVNGTDPFDLGADTVSSCGIDLGDFGGAAVAMLTDTCSYPSQQPNSDPSDCIITGTGTDPCEGVDCADGNPCTVDACDGSSGQAMCVYAPGGQGAVCRPAAGICDVAEFCDGTANTCPTDSFASGAVCRAATGDCDVAESCMGNSAQCPADAKSTSECRTAAGPCDVPESCDGTADTCPTDSFATGTVCRTAAGVCDLADSCAGDSAQCPADAKSHDVCRAAAGPCDVAETCDGRANNCPPDAVASADKVCRRAYVECDIPESCDGMHTACPQNHFQPAGMSCADDYNACTDEMCDGHGDCVHPPNDVHACDDFDPCTAGETCVDGQCLGERICEPTCRTAGFWGTHGGDEKGGEYSEQVTDITGAVIVAHGGSINVCGQVVDRSIPIGNLGSALEGLCAPVEGEQVRQLYRQLIAFTLNCILSREDADCNVLLPIASECNLLCAGGDASGVTEGDCIAQLDCFNNGGRFVPGVGCALGECENESWRFCGGNFPGCPDICTAKDPETHLCTDTTAQSCVPFENSCHERDLCPADTDGDGIADSSGFCFEPVPASSSRACHRAAGNDCTVDSCSSPLTFSGREHHWRLVRMLSQVFTPEL